MISDSTSTVERLDIFTAGGGGLKDNELTKNKRVRSFLFKKKTSSIIKNIKVVECHFLARTDLIRAIMMTPSL